ncbi:MAG: hypothetical protein D5R96_09425 [Methanocalculus sp. MSAO_Arc2]|uniref:hypothetical protein n=1 Tax=unclassified Methanocalculus TaxID=2631035 RepID=UPI000FF84BE9|nr:hypothetical protein [Methanocalculus sp. AMF5]MCP1661861.1 hypothetical protein [Methanocalculus sp. AMF5]RQD79842.1 MAG: hypothetical protein D5R96_09425 [Methanocalculus sp. MSAO_Arc2]
MEDKIKIELSGYEVIRKEVKKYGSGSSATLYLPGDWGGQLIACVRLGPATDEEDTTLLPWGQWVRDLPGERIWMCPYCLTTILCEAFPDGPFERDEVVLCGECDRHFKIGTQPRWKQQVTLEDEEERKIEP